MRVLILDPYPIKNCRVSKDTNGGFGTANDYGDGLVARFLSWLKSLSVDWPPLYAVYVAGVLRNSGDQVVYSKVRSSRFISEQNLSNIDICLVTSSIVGHETEIEVIHKLNSIGIPVGVIGPFATTVPEPYLAAGAFVISGEPEIFFSNHSFAELDIYKMKGIIKSSEITPLDNLPLPAWDLIFQKNRPRYKLLNFKDVALPILASRGCPYSCFHYCTYPLQQGRKVRLRSPEKIVEEMIHWQDTLGVSLFIFRDPVFSIDRQHTLQLCELLISSRRKFKFVIETHLNRIDCELAIQLRQAGLQMVKTGVESFNKDILKSSKRFFLEHDTEINTIRFIEKLGIKVTCFYILCLPDDSVKNCEDTLRYAKILNTYGAQFSIFTPYPGTPIFDKYKNIILTDCYEHFTQWNLVFKHDQLSQTQIREFISKAYSSYYTNPSWFFKFIAYYVSK